VHAAAAEGQHPQNAAAVLSQPRLFKHLDTLMPLPPTSTRRDLMRLTLPAVRFSITTVLSMAGFNVSV
jgi:hypothetical protein